jgi:hypothetical protein
LVARYWSNRIEANFIAEVLGNLEDINPHIRGCIIASKSLIDIISLFLVHLRKPSSTLGLPSNMDSGEQFESFKTI